jgi:hypothetical protein
MMLSDEQLHNSKNFKRPDGLRNSRPATEPVVTISTNFATWGLILSSFMASHELETSLELKSYAPQVNLKMKGQQYSVCSENGRLHKIKLKISM